MTEVPAKVRRRLTSVKRASDPYDAEGDEMSVWWVRTRWVSRKVEVWFLASWLTEIVCGDYDAIFELDAED